MNRQVDHRWLTYILPAIVTQFETSVPRNTTSYTQDLLDQVELFRKLTRHIKDLQHSRFHVLDDLFLNTKVNVLLSC
jgi:hypothetical protein